MFALTLATRSTLTAALGLCLTLSACDSPATSPDPDGGPDGSTADSSADTGGADTSGPDGAGSCGGIAGLRCAAGSFCDFALADQCGAADQTGTCTPIPEACTASEDPVCGCDNQSYGNACQANAAGVAVASQGACVSVGQRCGGKVAPGTNNGCAEGEYCVWEDGSCGFNDSQGTCQPRPDGRACPPPEGPPICGCDGQVSATACRAAGGGVDVSADLSICPTLGLPCGGKAPPGTSVTCTGEEFCFYAREAMCGATDATGTCQPRPLACPPPAGEVCGCDNQTYASECDALVARVSVLSDGACP